MRVKLLILICLFVPNVSLASLTFAGINTGTCVGYADSPRLNNMSKQTWMGWFYSTGGDATSRIMARANNNQWGLGAGANNSRLTFGRSVNLAYVINDTAIVANTWTFVAFTLDESLGSNNAHMYHGTTVNNLHEDTYGTHTDGDSSAAFTDDSGAWRIGAQNAGGCTGGTFTGKIDRVMVFNRVLSLSELKSQMNCFHVTTGTVGYWVFGNRGTKSNLTQSDYSGFKDNGTASGTPVSMSAPLKFCH